MLLLAITNMNGTYTRIAVLQQTMAFPCALAQEFSDCVHTTDVPVTLAVLLCICENWIGEWVTYPYPVQNCSYCFIWSPSFLQWSQYPRVAKLNSNYSENRRCSLLLMTPRAAALRIYSVGTEVVFLILRKQWPKRLLWHCYPPCANLGDAWKEMIHQLTSAAEWGNNCFSTLTACLFLNWGYRWSVWVSEWV